MQIGGCIMETGEIPDDFQAPKSPVVVTDMGVVIKRESNESSPSNLSDIGDSTEHIWDSISVLNKEPPVNTDCASISLDKIAMVASNPLQNLRLPPTISVIQKTENLKKEVQPAGPVQERTIKNLKNQLKIHLESSSASSHQLKKPTTNLQDEIYKQQNSLIHKSSEQRQRKHESRNHFDQKPPSNRELTPSYNKLTKMFSIIAPKIDQETSSDPIDSKLLEHLPNEPIKSWLQRLAQLQQHKSRNFTPNLLEVTPDIHIQSVPAKTSESKKKIQTSQVQQTACSNPQRIVNYCDLPYMGEMTLDNCKPRRGRKPKKADICHLIYKNYGTIIPGNPQNSAETIVPNDPEKLDTGSLCRSDVQNKIISSLLEKRLTLETKRNRDAKLKTDETKQDEPLNLCIRDLNQLKIRLLRRHDNIYETESTVASPVSIKPEPQSDDEVEFVNETRCTSVIKKIPESDEETKDVSKVPKEEESKDGVSEPVSSSGGYVFWPNASVFVHPMALQSQMLYYQKLVNNNCVPSPNAASPSNSNSSTGSKKAEPSSPPATDAAPREKTKRNHHTNATIGSNSQPPTKRKRSAIFIPPIPSENQTNPATEVSICKFKFTGGAKPSLQEKKMLSVDSGGNFRYYSGTGDKSMRGYEFFPRETLQQQANQSSGSSTGSNSSSGVFLNASGEKLPLPIPENSPAIRPHFLLSGDPLLLGDSTSSPTSPGAGANSSEQLAAAVAAAAVAARNKKRKTRKSLQREKLEQTFKEKGFLIQTQQLESAEGATYCKFRQLRKFTRYLFRSWKDYLPGNVRDMNMENNGSEPVGSSGHGSVDKSDCDEDDYDLIGEGCSSTMRRDPGDPGETPSDDVSVSSDNLNSVLPDRTSSPP